MLELHLSDPQFHYILRCLILEIWRYLAPKLRCDLDPVGTWYALFFSAATLPLGRGFVVINGIFNMMTSWNGNLFRVAGPLCWEFTGDRWIPHTKASDAELWCFLWYSSWGNNRDAGDMRRYRAPYYVTVMNAPSYLDFVFIIRFIIFMWCIYEYFAFTGIALHPGLKVILKDANLAHWILLQIEWNSNKEKYAWNIFYV